MPENNKYLIDLIHNSLDSYGDSPAFKNTNRKSITYSELRSNLNSNTFFRNYSSDCGLIAVLSEKKFEVIEIFLAALLSGNAYLPLDYHSPAERILFILKNAGVKMLMVEKSNSDKYSKALEIENIRFNLKEYNNEYTAIIFDEYKTYSPELAYVLYTSGSTGLPKGVMHSHLSAFTFIDWCNRTFQFKKGNNFIAIAPFNFDLSILDIFVSLRSGGCLFIPSYSEVSNSRMIAKHIEDLNIHVIYSTPTFFKTLMSFGKIENKQFDKISHLLIAGEQLMGNVVLDLSKHFTKAEYYNLYGPTETNVCLFYKIDPKNCIAEQPVPIGKACDHTNIELTKKDELNELLISGNSIMLGYVATLNQKYEIYNTGDLVKKDANNDLVFVGRTDRMVKRSGYRIELAEIEACLKKHADVTECTMGVIKKGDDLKIAAFFVSQQKITDLQLKNYCLEQLPAYMIPDVFVQVNELKVNSNYKIDINKLLIENDLGHLI